jgi:hypothetical protein
LDKVKKKTIEKASLMAMTSDVNRREKKKKKKKKKKKAVECKLIIRKGNHHFLV